MADKWEGLPVEQIEAADSRWEGLDRESIYEQQAHEEGARLFVDPELREDPSLVRQGLDVLKDQAGRTALPPMDTEQAEGLWEHLNAGFDHSVSGLMMGRPELAMEQEGDMLEHFAFLIGQLGGDLPTMVAGYIGGAAAAAPQGAAVGGAVGSVVPGAGTAVGAATGATITSIVAGGAAAAALTEGSRRWLLEGYAKGESKRSMAERLAIAGGAAGKWGFIGGLTTGVGGKVTQMGAKAGMNPMLTAVGARGSEVATMVTAAGVLEGQLPEPKDFVDAGVLVAGLTGAGFTARKAKPLMDRAVKNMKERFIAEGIHPAAQAQEALLNANVRAGLLREEDVSMARRMLADATETAVKPDAKLFDQIYTSVIDDLNPLRMATRALGFTKDRVLAAAKDPYVLARLARGATGRVQARVRELHQALAEFDPGVQTIGSARRILGGGKHHRFSEGFLGDLRDYLVSGRTLELELRGIKSGADAEGLALAKKTFDEAPPHIKAAAQKMYDWQNANLKRLKDAGFLDDASFKNIMEMNRMYVPFKRAFSAEEQAAMRTSKGAGTVLKSIRGSERQIVDPFETIMENAYVIEQRIAGNMANKALVELGIGTRVKQKRLPTKLSAAEAKDIARMLDLDSHAFRDIEGFKIFRPKKNELLDSEIEVYIKGKRQVYEVGTDMAKAIRGIDATTNMGWLKIFTLAPNLLRSMTIISPDFMARNIIRDNITAGVYSKSFWPMKDFFKGLASFAKQDKWYTEWQKSGGENASLAQADRQASSYLFHGAERQNFQPTPWNVVKTAGRVGMSPYRFLQRLSEAAENATRIGEFRRAIEKGATKTEAGFRSREVTLDFARKGGHTMRVANQLVAFLNVQIQGIDRFARAYKENPKGAMIRTFTMVTAPSIMLWYHNKDQEWYQEMAEWRKNTGWLFSFDNGETVYTIPKPHEIGYLFGSLPERMLDAMYLDDPNAVDEMMHMVFDLIVPDITPTTVSPISEVMNNRVKFTDAPVVRSDILNMLTEYQYTEHSTEMAKATSMFIAELGLPFLEGSDFASPVAIDHITNSWAGTMGRNIIRSVDKMWKESMGDVEPPDWTLSDIPFIRAFVVRHPSGGSESIQNFMDISQDFMKATQTLDKMMERADVTAVDRILDRYGDKLADLSGIRKTLSEQRGVIKQIYSLPGMPGEEKRQLIDDMYKAMILTARGGMEVVKELERLDEQDQLNLFQRRRGE